MNDRDLQIHRLRRSRPRSLYLRMSIVSIVLLIILSWSSGWLVTDDPFTPRRRENLRRFLREIQPLPVRDGEIGFAPVCRWASDLVADPGLDAALATLSIATASIVLAAVGALILVWPAARTVASSRPFGVSASQPGRMIRIAWLVLVAATRGIAVFFRAVPEYVWAFLFLAMFGPRAWPAVLALAVHNAGILAKLGAEVVENVVPAVPAGLRSIGASRRQVVVAGILPTVLPRFLLFFAYRWETCVREATVLGLLGFSSLGYWILDARARDRYDDMILFMLIGAVLVLIGDYVSVAVRSILRRVA